MRARFEDRVWYLHGRYSHHFHHLHSRHLGVRDGVPRYQLHQRRFVCDLPYGWLFAWQSQAIGNSVCYLPARDRWSSTPVSVIIVAALTLLVPWVTLGQFKSLVAHREAGYTTQVHRPDAFGVLVMRVALNVRLATDTLRVAVEKAGSGGDAFGYVSGGGGQTAATTSTTMAQQVIHAEAPAPVFSQQAAPNVGDPWECIASYESGGGPPNPPNWSINTGNGYSGGLQIANSEWAEYAPPGDQAGIAADWPPSVQIAAAERLLEAQGWGAWPHTAPLCGR
jgi:hypothetical protein